MKKYNVVIIGAGLAGLQCAKLIAKKTTGVLLVDRKDDLTKGVHTTGIFVRKTFEDFEFPSQTLGKPISNVTLYSPKLNSLELNSEKEEFRVGRMGLLYSALLEECSDLGVEFSNKTRYVSAKKAPGGTVIRLERNGVATGIETQVLIGADGARSRVAKDLELDENREWIVGYEEVFKGVPPENEARLHCFLDAKLAPGYLAWITNDGEESHIGVGGYPARFNPREALKQFKKEIAPEFVNLKTADLIETRGGRIPVGGVLRRIANRHGLVIGDAAGAVSPLTAGGLDPCMRLSKFAAEVVLESLMRSEPNILLNYSGKMFRSKFATRLWLRYVLKSLNQQSLLELGFKFMKGRLGRRIAEKIFFRRSSFPDVELNTNANILSPKVVK